MPMDVKFTSSSGIQMPLANIVESSIDDDNGFIRFNNGIQIDYALTNPLGDTSSKPYIHGCVIYKKPFIARPTLTLGRNSLVLYKYVNVNGMNLPVKSKIYDDNEIVINQPDSFAYINKTYSNKEGFPATVKSESNIINEATYGCIFTISYIAIGRWK